ncbi:hypothetical protein WN55_00122 [Dufourea novaeangliae]|uniref:Uncharacterized protein n=1 Tax=Dufourea novaeangliae TaxID=178035 RepID=A0A154NWL4_DUFNO|nr:hypothetical protein WN55_00122 [Dufourea novaeangliae]
MVSPTCRMQEVSPQGISQVLAIPEKPVPMERNRRDRKNEPLISDLGGDLSRRPRLSQPREGDRLEGGGLVCAILSDSVVPWPPGQTTGSLRETRVNASSISWAGIKKAKLNRCASDD